MYTSWTSPYGGIFSSSRKSASIRALCGLELSLKKKINPDFQKYRKLPMSFKDPIHRTLFSDTALKTYSNCPIAQHDAIPKVISPHNVVDFPVDSRLPPDEVSARITLFSKSEQFTEKDTTHS